MPNVFIEMLEGRTVEQKRELVEKITEVIVNILKVDPSIVNVRILNVKRDDLARGGKLFIDR
jgi:4-oxalocrotonate tautomerase